MNCRQFARRAASDGLSSAVPGGSTAAYVLHWLACPFCRRYRYEIRRLGRLCRRRVAASHLREVQRRLRLKLAARFGKSRS